MIHHLTPDQLYAGQVEKRQDSIKPVRQVKQVERDFKSLLSEKLRRTQIKFSAHASQRLEKRGINLSENDLQSLEKAVNLAHDKGSRDTLVLHEKAAFVVSVKNRTVITAIDDTNMKERVVTNIDSTVIARDL